MRIAVLTSLYPSSVRPAEGVFAERRWQGMRARGHDVRVVHPLPWAPVPFGKRDWAEIARMARREERGGIAIERPRYLHVPRRARANARRFAARGVRTLLARERPDVVVLDYAWPASAAAPLLAREGVACVINGRGSDVLQVAGEAGLAGDLAANLRAAGNWCAVSRDLVERMDALAQTPGRGVLVANGVDIELFHPRPRDRARDRLAIDAAATLVLVVGHLIERKDPLLALEAFDELSSERFPRKQLVFVGRGPLEGTLRDEIARRNLGARVQLVGEQPPAALADWYCAADLLLLCSVREGRPNVVLEALASGTPVLATDAGGTRELLDGLDGMLAKTRDPAELAQLATNVLTRPRDERRLAVHVSALTWDASLRALEGVLSRAIESRRSSGA